MCMKQKFNYLISNYENLLICQYLIVKYNTFDQISRSVKSFVTHFIPITVILRSENISPLRLIRKNMLENCCQQIVFCLLQSKEKEIKILVVRWVFLGDFFFNI